MIRDRGRQRQLGQAAIQRYEFKIISKDGNVFPVEIDGRFFTWRGKGVHEAAIRDITDRKKAEEERLELERQLLHAQKLKSLGVLAIGMMSLGCTSLDR